MKIRTEKVIDDEDWDILVRSVYGKPYCFQQQNGCQNRGRVYITVPTKPEDYENDTMPEIVNYEESMGVSFKAWLERDPYQKFENRCHDFELQLWWERNFYPDISMVINDLHAKGYLEAGEYTINVDW
jgi:hypothetical protein